MAEHRTAPYGTWESPVTTELVAGQTIGLSALSADDGVLYWLEGRPSERGRTVLVRRAADGRIADVTPTAFDVASRVHEYGGGAYVARDGRVLFSNKADGAVWLIEGDAAARQVTAVAGCRYADFRLLDHHAICVREDHRGRPANDPAAAIVALDLAGGADPATNEGRILVQGADFYAAPRPSPDGTRLAWIEWDHPDMPWDATRLRVAALDPATVALGDIQAEVAEGSSLVGPDWLADGTLLVCSDRNGWWNLQRLEGEALQPLHPMQAEVGGPHWVFGQRWWTELPGVGLLACPIAEGRSEAVLLDPRGAVTLGLQAAEPPVVLGRSGDGTPILAWVGVSADAPPAVLLGSPDGEAITLRASGPRALAPGDVSVAEPIRFPSGGEVAHAWWYPPTNSRFQAPAGTRPPLIVISHGGPTAMSGRGFSPRVQWWTSRGFAVVDVNYGGSTGFGRAYRQRLDRAWGEVDVADCIAAVRFLVEAGRVDPERVAIRGGSAGGFTTLMALTSSDVFRAGASHYGVADLSLLAADTHKFEARYLDRLVGPLPQAEATYAARSPLERVEHLACPVIFFQGVEDKVVPPSQARTMVAAMRSRGIGTALYEFEDEGHGFRRSDTMRRVLELELDFYGQVFRFIPAGSLERVTLQSD